MDETKKQPKVIVFSTPTCSYCNAAKSYFRQKGVKYRDVDVSRDPAAARDMVRVREARRAFRELYTQCFWSEDPNYRITLEDVPWVAERLMRYGGHEGWERGAKLCR